jgi:hypothetical protein
MGERDRRRESTGSRRVVASSRFFVLGALLVGVLVFARLSLPAVAADETPPDFHIRSEAMCAVCHRAK